MATSRFGVLFDIDGVIVRDKALLNRVGHNCTSFVQRISKSPLELNKAYQINYKLYKNHGHTLRGIYQSPEYDNDKKQRLHKLFVEHVYDRYIYHDLHTYLASSAFTEHSAHFADICDMCASNGISVGILSNAPNDWCEIVLSAIKSSSGSGHDLVKSEMIYSSSHMCMHPYLFKPDDAVYGNIEKDLLSKSHDQKLENILFIDDSLTNLLPIVGNPLWTPIQFDEDAPNNTKVGTNIVTTKSMKDVFNMIDDRVKLSSPIVDIYFEHESIKNADTVKMVLKSCIPYLSTKWLDSIISNVEKRGESVLTTCTLQEADAFCSCLIDNGFAVRVKKIK
jgi:FMN phosphatase YigB (HAD superfamily)